MKEKRMKNSYFPVSSAISSKNTKTNERDVHINRSKTGDEYKKKLSTIGDLGSVDSGSSKGTPRRTPKKKLNQKDFSPPNDSNVENKIKGYFTFSFFHFFHIVMFAFFSYFNVFIFFLF